MQRQRRHFAAERGDHALRIQRPKPLQQFARLRQHRRGRGINPGQARGIRAAPQRQVERQRREIRLADLGGRECGEARMRTLAPQPVTAPGRGAAGATGALVSGRARDARDFQPAHAGRRIEARAPRESCVDDHGHAGDGHAGLGDVGRQHHAPHASHALVERRILLLSTQIAVQRQQLQAQTGQVSELRLHAPDLARARQEHQQIAAGLIERLSHRARDKTLRRFRTARQERCAATVVEDLDVKHPAGHVNHRRIAQERGDARAIECRRHHQHAKVGVERAAGIEAQCEPQVGLQAAFVKLVEDHAANAGEFRIGVQHAGEHAFGDDFDARRARHPRVEPHAVADNIADLLAAQPGHAPRHGARGHPARFEQQDLAAAEPRFIKQRQRHQRALARARRRPQHGVTMSVECRAQRANQRLVNERRGHAHGAVGSRARSSVTAATHQPAISDSPPSGVTRPTMRGAPHSSAYRLPENSSTPASSRSAATRSPRLLLRVINVPMTRRPSALMN